MLKGGSAQDLTLQHLSTNDSQELVYKHFSSVAPGAQELWGVYSAPFLRVYPRDEAADTHVAADLIKHNELVALSPFSCPASFWLMLLK